jgi:uncharacterized RDD family membrane protein YckC
MCYNKKKWKESDFMKQATAWQRFGAFIIDFILIIILLEIFSRILSNFVKLPVLTEELINTMPEKLLKIYKQNPDSFLFYVNTDQELNAAFVTWTQSAGVQEYVNNYIQAAVKITAITLLTLLVIVFLYYVLLPRFWKHQTLGRLFTKTKVITTDGTKLGIPQLLLREIVGGYIFYLFNVCCGLTFFINMIFVLTKNQTIGDMFARTIYVRLDNPKDSVNESHDDNNNNYNNHTSDNIFHDEYDDYSELEKRYGTQNPREKDEIIIDVGNDDDKD